MPFPESPRVIYQNNPLVEVICQIRFPTILEISAEEPAVFQKKIRSRYPLYIRDQGGISVPKEFETLIASIPIPKPVELLTHKFLTEESKRFISLARNFLAISEQQYRRWEEFRQEIQQAQAALEEIYQPAFYSRVGLRYQDVIDKEKLDLKHETWSSLLNPAFLGVLGASEVQNHIQHVHAEALIKVSEVKGGFLHLQHGLGMHSRADHETYLIDADFFTEDKEETKHVSRILDIFNRLAGNFFRWAITPRLQEALNPVPVA